LNQLPSLPNDDGHALARPFPASAPLRTDGGGSAAGGPDLGYVARVLAGRRWAIAAIMLATTILVAAGAQLIRDRYTAEALLLVDEKEIRIVRDNEPAQQRMPGDDSGILSEVEILRSDRVLDRVIDELSLLNDPEYRTGAGERPTPTRVVAGGLTDAAGAIWGGAPPAMLTGILGSLRAAAAVPPPPTERARREDVRLALQRNIAISVAGRSNVIKVRGTGHDPERTAAVVNSLINRYLDLRLSMERAMAADAIGQLRQRIDLLRGELVSAEHEVEQLRFKSGLTKGLVGPLAAQDLETARQRLTQASADRARTVAQAETLEKALRGNPATSGGSIASEVVGDLRGSYATVQAELAQLSRQYGPLHPRVVELKARLDQTAAALRTEVQREIAGVREAANVAIEQEKALKELIAGLEARYAANLGDQGVKLRGLEAEAQAKRSLMEGLLKRLEEVQAVQDGRTAPGGVKQVAAAVVPFEPSGPPRLAISAAGLVGSGLLAVLLVFALELMQRRVRGPEDVRRILGAASVHLVPRPDAGNPHAQLFQIFRTHPFSLFAESMRALFRNRLDGLGPVAAVAVTSARPQDGKTALSLALAQAAAQGGRNVVLVDTDFRRSRLDTLFKFGTKPGLSDWLAGEATLEDIVQTPPDVPFAVIPAGRLGSDTLDRFTGEAVTQLINALSARFDLMLFDTAPALAVSDARIVCAAASRVVFVTRWGHTRASDLRAVADLGPIDHARFVCVLTDVNVKRLAGGYYGAPYPAPAPHRDPSRVLALR
jgi:polysaccharide biosynthesis transport protein